MKRFFLLLILNNILTCKAQNSWHDVGGGIHNSSGGPGYSNVLVSDTINNLLYIGGVFSLVGTNNITAHKVTSWNGSQYAVLGCPSGLDWQLVSPPQVGTFYNGKPVMGSKGSMYIPGYCGNNLTGGHYIASYNGFDWESTAAEMIPFGMLYCITTYQGEMVVGGEGISVTTSVGPIDPHQIAITSGNLWEVLGDSINYGVYWAGHPSFSVEGAIEFNGELFVSGIFDHAGNLTLSNFGIARWNGLSWLNAGSNFTGSRTFGIYNNELYLGTYNGSLIYKWTGTDWILFSQTDFTPGNTINKIIEYDGKMIVTGIFDSIGGVSANNIAMWDGIQWSDMNGGIECTASQPPCTVGYDLAVYDGSLYVAGFFDLAGGVSTHGIARWGPTVGIDELTVNQLLLLINPNPVNQECTITCSINNAAIILYDITGRILLTQPFSNTAKLEFGNLAAGVYIVEVRDKQGKSVKGKLIKN